MKEEAFTGELVEALSRKGYDASPAYCIRNNGGKAVLAFHGTSPYSPAFDTGPLVERYRKGMPVGEIAGRLADRLEQASAAGRMLRYLQPGASRYREIRQNLWLCMVRREGNTEFLSETPHRPYGDFAAVVCWALDGEVEISMVMGKEALDGIGTDFDRVFRDAHINMMGEFELKSMEEMLYETVAGKLEMETRQMRDIPADRYIRKMCRGTVLYRMTHRTGRYGSAAMCYRREMERVAERIRGDFVLIPASIHELLFLPLEGITHLEAVNGLVRRITEELVEAEERLSGTAYVYSEGDGSLTGIPEYLSRTRAGQAGTPGGRDRYRADTERGYEGCLT